MADAKVSFHNDVCPIDQNFQTILREFLGLPSTGEEEAFPHENKTTNTGNIRKSNSHESWTMVVELIVLVLREVIEF